ncbi:MAG: hydantoinase/carbamoylase family amidase [Pseudomonadota bacterium]
MTTAAVGRDAIRRAVAHYAATRDELFDRVAACSIGATDPSDGITRDTYGPGEQAAHAAIASWAVEQGFEVSEDAARSLYITLPGADRTLPRIMFGSHLDSVPHGGNFDGAAGVIGGLIAMCVLRDLDRLPAADITTMAIRAEESIWFQVSYIGSRSAFGALPDGALSAKRIDTGRSLSEHMSDCGADVIALRNGHAHLDPADISAFIELHIEQAPQLVEAGRPIAIGTGIPGNVRHPLITITGEHAHVGLPRRFRRDAMLAGSDFARGLDEIWLAAERTGRPMAFTIGRAGTDETRHGLTIVPGTFTLSLDLRAYDATHLASLENEMHAIARRIEAERGVRFNFGARASAPCAPSDAKLVAELSQAADRLGINSMPLASPASHDTAVFAEHGVSTAMVFIRNENGSHNPSEAMDGADLLAAIEVVVGWLASQI